MPRLPLAGGSASPRSVIANAQRCVNLYPEQNGPDAPVPYTFYQRPGLLRRVAGDPLPVRGLYQASNGKQYAVIGQKIYLISADWVLTQIGTLALPASVPVSMIDNGISDLLLVDSTANGYQINLATDTVGVVVDASGIFAGGRKVDYFDTFLLWGPVGSGGSSGRQFGSSLSNVLTFDPTYVAGKAGYPDPLQTLIVNRRELVLLGSKKGEIWYNAGGTNFPFAELPGTYIEHGTVAPYSVVAEDINVYWLSQDLQGQGQILRLRGSEIKRVSNFTVEAALLAIVKSGKTLSDCVAYTYQQWGHVFVVFSWQAGDQTWVYDASIEDPVLAWHQRGWTDANGVLHRERANCGCYINGQFAVGDWQNGTIYTLDSDTYVDQVADGTQSPIACVRGFPHILGGIGPQGFPLLADGRKMQFKDFTLDMECGNGPLDVNGDPAQVWFRISADRGKTWQQARLQSNGAPGAYETQPHWPGLAGMARDMVFEVGHSIAGPAALNGAWINVVPTGN